MPRKVFIVRWASGVTTIMQRPVGTSSVAEALLEGDADGAEVVAEHLAQARRPHLADVGGAAAEAGDAGHRVGRRAAGQLDAGAAWRRRATSARSASMSVIEPLTSACGVEEGVVVMGDDVDQGVADADDVEVVHGATLSDGRAPRPARDPPVRSTVVSDNPYRLPRTGLPDAATTCVLEPDLDAGPFTGTVDVALDVMSTATDELVCNAVDLEIDAAWRRGPTVRRSTRREARRRHRAPPPRAADHPRARYGHAPPRLPGHRSTTCCAASTARPSPTTTATRT